MAEFTPSKKTVQDFNNGVEYIDDNPENGIMGDAVQAESINNIIESQLWTQALATNPVDNSETNNVGIPSIELATMPDGTPRLKAKNLKGEQGVQGKQGIQGKTGNGVASTVISYATSTSGTITPADSAWQTTIPAVSKGNYLWARTIFTYTEGTPKTTYTVAYQGKDGVTPTIDTTLSTTSTNPVQNKIVANAINEKYTKPSSGIPKTDLASNIQQALNTVDSLHLYRRVIQITKDNPPLALWVTLYATNTDAIEHAGQIPWDSLKSSNSFVGNFIKDGKEYWFNYIDARDLYNIKFYGYDGTVLTTSLIGNYTLIEVATAQIF